MIKVHQVSYGYEGHPEIISNLNYTFESKMSYLIIGDNGVGKTTLIKLLLGLLKPTAGMIEQT